VPTSKSKTVPVNQMIELAEKMREQLVESVRKGQQLAVDAAKTWVDATSAVAPPNLPKLPGSLYPLQLATVTTFPFNLAADLLDTQRKFAVQLTSVLVAAKSA